MVMAIMDGWWLFRLRRLVRFTVLTISWWWCLCLLAAAVAVFVLHEFVAESSSSADQLRWLLLVAGFCPFVSRLGAKRPQHRAWHWVVLSFWIVAGLPAWQSLLGGHHFETSGMWELLFISLVVMQIVDHLGTRTWLAPWFLAAAQVVLHPAPHWWMPLRDPSFCLLVSWWLGSTALLVTLVSWRRLPPTIEGWTRVWQAFRDRMGVLWSLRVLQRFNADARNAESRRSDPQIELTWAGFVREGGGLHAYERELPESAARVFQNLLRRFVDSQWIDRQSRESTASVGPSAVVS